MGVVHERPEVRLVVAPVDLLAQRDPLERERGLRGENLESAAQGEQHGLARGDDEQPPRRSGGGSVKQHERARQRGPEPLQLPGGWTLESVDMYEPARPVGASGAGPSTPAVAPSVSNTARCGEPAGTRRSTAVRTPAATSAASAADDQVVTGRAQDALPLDRLPVSCHHAGQPRQDEQEQDGGQTWRSSARSRTSPVSESASSAPGATSDTAISSAMRRMLISPDGPRTGNREIGHRRMQGRGTPGRVEERPAEVVGVADRVRTAELFEAVAHVGHQEAGRADTEQNGCPVAAGGDEQAGERRHDEDVAERVGDRRCAFDPRELAVPDVRVDEEDPSSVARGRW